MAKDRITKATIQWGVDQESLNSALRDIEQIRQGILGLTNVGASKAVPGLGPTMKAGIPAPPPPGMPGGAPPGHIPGVTPTWAQGQSGFQWQSGGQPSVGGAPSQFQSVTLNGVQTVNISGATIQLNVSGANISGGGGYGGGGAPGMPGVPGMPGSGPGPGVPGPGGVYMRPRNFFTQMTGNPFLGYAIGSLMPLTPYAAPVALAQMGISAYNETQLQYSRNLLQQGQFATDVIGGGGIGIAQEYGLAQSQRDVRGGATAWKDIGRNWIVNAVTFGQSSYMVNQYEIALEREKDVAVRRAMASAGIIKAGLGGAGAQELELMRLDAAMMESSVGGSTRTNTEIRRRIQGQNLIEGAMPYLGWQYRRDPFFNQFSQNLTGKPLSGLSLEEQRAMIDPLGRAFGYAAQVRPELAAGIVSGMGAGQLAQIAQSEIMVAAARGDVSGYATLAPLAPDAWKDEGRATLNSGIFRARDMRTSQSNVGFYQSRIRGSSAGGAGYQTLQGFNAGIVSELRGQERMQQQTLSMIMQSGNQEAIASERARLAEIQASIRERQRYDMDVERSERFGVAEARISMASTSTRRTALTGTSARANAGYEQQFGAIGGEIGMMQDFYGRYRGMMNPAERAQMEAQIAAEQLRLQEARRGRVFDVYEESQSGIGVRAAGVRGSVTRQELFGGPTSVREAREQELGVVDARIRAEQELLSSLQREGATVKETNDIRAKIRDLQTDRMRMEEEHKRAEYSGLQSLGHMMFATGGSQAEYSRMYGGSFAGAGNETQQLQSIRTNRTRAEAERARLMGVPGADPKGPAISALNQEIAGYNLQERQFLVSTTEYTPDVAFRRRELANNVGLAITTQTMSGYGDVRGGYERKLQMAGDKVAAIRARAAAKMKEATNSEDRALIAEAAERQIAGIITGEAIPAQQALESGWQERLISEVHGANSNFNMVASQFTKREGALFYNVVNRAFGSNSKDIDRFRGQGSMWYNTFSGSVGRPEGFFQTAMSGMSEDAAREVRLGGEVKLDITIREGNTVTKTQQVVRANEQSLTATIKENRGGMGG